MRSGRARGTTTTAATTMALLSVLLAGPAVSHAAAPFGRRLQGASMRRGYAAGFLAPVGLLASSTPAAVGVVKASATSNNNNGPRTADLVSRRGGATGGGGVFGSITRLFSGRGGDAIRTEAPAVGALEAGGPGAGEGWKGDLLVLPVFQAEEGEGLVEVGGQPILAAWDEALGGAVAELVQTVRGRWCVWVFGRCNAARHAHSNVFAPHECQSSATGPRRRSSRARPGAPRACGWAGRPSRC